MDTLGDGDGAEGIIPKLVVGCDFKYLGPDCGENRTQFSHSVEKKIIELNVDIQGNLGLFIQI